MTRVRNILLKLLMVTLTPYIVVAQEASLPSFEYRFVPELCSAVEAFINNNHAIPTNMSQLQNWLTVEGWAWWEEKFKEFGEHAGFSNSIFEKYVFLPSGVFFQIRSKTFEAVLMNAQPFSDGRGATNRWVIHRTGEVINRSLLPEEKVQGMLRRAGIDAPKPPPMISAIELDTPRRQEEAQRQQDMDEQIKQSIAEEERKGAPRPPRVRTPPLTPNEPKDKAGEATKELGDPNSRIKIFGIVLVLIVGSLFALFAFRQARRR
jgi:hypothetical protein